MKKYPKKIRNFLTNALSRYILVFLRKSALFLLLSHIFSHCPKSIFEIPETHEKLCLETLSFRTKKQKFIIALPRYT